MRKTQIDSKEEDAAVTRDERRERAVERMRSRAWAPPDGYVFDRIEANDPFATAAVEHSLVDRRRDGPRESGV